MAITGIGINSNSNTNTAEPEAQIESILAAINAQNREIAEQQELEREQEEKEKRKKLDELDAAEEAEKNKKRYEKEQEAKRRRKEEEEQENAELEKKKERNPFYNVLKKMEGTKSDNSDDSEEETEEEETETYATFIARNVMEKSGDIIRSTKETLGEKKHNAVRAITEKLASIGGFELPEFKEYNPSEEFAKRKEQKQLKKEEREARKKEMEEKKKEQKEERARLEQEKKEALEKKKREQLLTKEALEAKKRREENEKKQSTAQKEAAPVATNASATQAETAKPLTPEEYDKYLSEEARELKTIIRKEHSVPDFLVTEHAVNEIQKMKDVIAIIIASADMNHLFIFHEPATFIELAEKLNKTMNYSYIYVVTTTAPVYFGSDRCYHGLTDLFNRIREIILRYGHVNRTVLLKIEGINMFKNIHLDA